MSGGGGNLRALTAFSLESCCPPVDPGAAPPPSPAPYISAVASVLPARSSITLPTCNVYPYFQPAMMAAHLSFMPVFQPAGGAPSRPRTRAVVLFPERGVGGREGGLRPWRLSPAYLAARTGWHIVPGYVLGE